MWSATEVWKWCAVLVLGLPLVALATANRAVIRHTPALTMSALADRAPDDVVEFADGKHVSVRVLHRLQAAQERMRRPAQRHTPPGLRMKPAGTGAALSDGEGIARALRGPDASTFRLPNGRLVTAGMIKGLRPLLEKRLGRSLTAAAGRPDLSGAAVKVTRATTKAEWSAILSRPEDTVLEAPNGHRVTVGMLKQTVGEHRKRAAATPVPILPFGQSDIRRTR